MTLDFSKTKIGQIYLFLNQMKKDDSINKEELINHIWGNCDHYIVRTFDVAFFAAKQKLPDRKFKVKNRIIKRIY